MYRIWYLLLFVVIVFIIWFIFKNSQCTEANGESAVPPTEESTIGFNSITVASTLIDSLYNRMPDVGGFRVYNAKTGSGIAETGLVVGAVDRDSSEIFPDASSYYFSISPDGKTLTRITRDQARDLVMEVVRDTTITNLISGFYISPYSRFWQNGEPTSFNFMADKYPSNGTELPNVKIEYLPPVNQGSMMSAQSRISIIGAPCPPYCPDKANMLYER